VREKEGSEYKKGLYGKSYNCLVLLSCAGSNSKPLILMFCDGKRTLDANSLSTSFSQSVQGHSGIHQQFEKGISNRDSNAEPSSLERTTFLISPTHQSLPILLYLPTIIRIGPYISRGITSATILPPVIILSMLERLRPAREPLRVLRVKPLPSLRLLRRDDRVSIAQVNFDFLPGVTVLVADETVV
jgi:hypothetical protein